MTNNSNSYDLDPKQVKDKTWDNDVIRATVLDVLPEIHAVRVNPRGDNSPFVAPVLTPKYGMHVLPGEGERVTLLYIAENVPVALGGVYLADGEDPPEADVGDVVFGNSTGSEVTIRENGNIHIATGEYQPINIDHQSGSVRMSADQTIAGDDVYEKVEFDTVQDDPEDLFDISTNSFTIRHGGQHRVESTVEIEAGGQNNRYTVGLFADGTLVKRKNRQSVVSEPMSVAISTTRRFEDDTNLDVRLRQDSGSDKIINSADVATEFSIERHGI